jgi:hypothetical protein
MIEESGCGNHPFLRSLRGDPRYNALLHKLKLPE